MYEPNYYDDDYENIITDRFEKISEEYSDGNGDYALYTGYFKRNNHKLEINIKAHYYKDQSFAKIKVFDFVNNKWNKLSKIDYMSMKTNRYILDDNTKALIQLDVEQLLNLCENILIR